MTLAEDIINGANIVDVINRYVSLTRAGANYKGLCPFHGEKSPSFVVSPQKQIFKCFGCGVGGDVITFIKEIEHVDFIEAAKILAKDAGVLIEEYQSKEYNPKHQNNKDRAYEMNRLAQAFFVSSLKKSSDALDYVRESRWLSNEMISKFGIGYAPHSYYEMIEYMKKKGYTVDQQTQTSLAKPSQRGASYAFFRDRVIFPIFDTRSRIVGFGGRAMSTDTQPKYINTTDTIIYDKSSVLYGINRAKSAVRDQWSMIIVEWYMDVIALHRLGYEAAVATCGTALTIQHMKTLKKYTDRIILLFDHDKAGVEATKRALSLAYTQDLYPLVMTLPEAYKDVDELAQAIDMNQFTTPDLMASTQDGLQYILYHLQQRIDTSSPIDKKRLLNQLFGLVAMVSSLSIQQHYLTLIAEQLKMNESIIIAEFQVFFADQKRRLQQQVRHADIAWEEQQWGFHPSEDQLLAALFLNQWIVEQLPDVSHVALLLERGEMVGWMTGWLLESVVCQQLDDSTQVSLLPIQLRREDEMNRVEGDQQAQYTLIIRKLWPLIQRMTQSALKLTDTHQKKKLIELLHAMS